MKRAVAALTCLALLSSCATVRRHRTASTAVGVTAFVTLAMGVPIDLACTPSAPDDCDATYDAKVFGGFFLLGAAVSALIVYESRGNQKRAAKVIEVKRQEPPATETGKSATTHTTAPVEGGDYDTTVSFDGNDDPLWQADIGNRTAATAKALTAGEACAQAKRDLFDQALDRCEKTAVGVGAISGHDNGCICHVAWDYVTCETRASTSCTDAKRDTVAVGSGWATLESVASDEALEKARAICGRYALGATAQATTCGCENDECTCLVLAACD